MRYCDAAAIRTAARGSGMQKDNQAESSNPKIDPFDPFPGDEEKPDEDASKYCLQACDTSGCVGSCIEKKGHSGGHACSTHSGGSCGATCPECKPTRNCALAKHKRGEHNCGKSHTWS